MSGEVAEVSTDRIEALELSRVDLNFLGALCDPEEFTLKFPPYYISLFGLLTSFKKRIERYAVGLPRGFAKTTFFKLMVVWCILHSPKKFILLVGAAEDLALNTLADIMDMLGSPNIRALFGDWDKQIYVNTQKLKVFHFRGRVIVLRAIGAESSVRGINRKNSRPDLILLDDIQKKEDAENAELAKKLLNWMTGTLMKAKSNFGCTYIFCGNMYPKNAILEKLKHASTWTSLIVGGILADGSSLWEELRPIDELIEEYEADVELGQGDVFCAEVLNSTDIPPAHGIDLNLIPQPPDFVLTSEPEGGYILIDPSSGKKQGDDCTIHHFSVVDGKSMGDELEFGTFTPIEVIKNALEMGMRHDTRLICVEDVAYQSTLLFWFQYVCDQEGITGFQFMPVSPKNTAKNTRIKKGMISLVKQEIYLHPNVRSHYITQGLEWNPAKTDNKDDIIDLYGYVDEVHQKYPHLFGKVTFTLTGNSQAMHESTSAF